MNLDLNRIQMSNEQKSHQFKLTFNLKSTVTVTENDGDSVCKIVLEWH